MSRRVFAIFVPAALMILAAQGCQDPPGANVGHKKIVAGKVSASETGAFLKGSFRIERALPQEGIASNGTGGACLVADLTHVFAIPPEGRCQTDQQCQDGLTETQQAADWAGFCIEGGCWVRPGSGEKYCTRNPNTPWPLDVDVTVPPNGDASRDLGANLLLPVHPEVQAVRWRVNACLNPAVGKGKDSPACRTGVGGAMHVSGPISMVPAR